MHPERTAIGTSAVAFVIVALVVIGAVAFTVLSPSSSPHTSSNTSSSKGTAVSTISYSSSPLPISDVEIGTVTIGGAPRTVAVNPNTGTIYVADYFYNNLTVVDSATNTVVARVSLPGNASNGIAVDPDTDLIYVLVEHGVAVVNGSTNLVIGEFTFNFGPGSLAFDQSTKTIYSSSGTGNGTLVGVNVRTGEVTMNVSLGYWANSVVVDPLTHVVVAVGCLGSFVCGSVASLVNGTDGRVINKVTIGNYDYPRVTMDLASDVAYVSGSAELVALNGTTGKVVYKVNSLACGPFDSMAIDASTGQLLAVYLDWNYVMVYDAKSGNLVNMYSFPDSPNYIVLDPITNLGYVTMGQQLLAFKNTASLGHVNPTLTGSGQHCALP